VDHGLTLKLAAASFNVSAKTAAKWVRRFCEAGTAGRAIDLCAPAPISATTSSPRKVLALRRLRYNGWRIAHSLGLSRGHGQPHPAPSGHEPAAFARSAAAVVRYEHKHPGDLIHFDIKRLARIVKPGHHAHGDRARETRGAGYEYLHIAIEPALSEAEGTTPVSASPPSCPTKPHRSALLFFFITPGVLLPLQLFNQARADRQ